MTKRRDHPLLTAVGILVLFMALVAVAPRALLIFAAERLLRLRGAQRSLDFDLTQRWAWAVVSSVLLACVMAWRSRNGLDRYALPRGRVGGRARRAVRGAFTVGCRDAAHIRAAKTPMTSGAPQDQGGTDATRDTISAYRTSADALPAARERRRRLTRARGVGDVSCHSARWTGLASSIFSGVHDPIETVITSSGLCLPKAVRGPRGSWWLRHPSGAFHNLRRRCPGHLPFSVLVRLPEGQYVLGVGEIRIAVRVTPLGTSTRPAAR